MDLEKKILSDLTVHMKYARYLDSKKRRENWEELVNRNQQMHIKNFLVWKKKLEMHINM